MHVALKIAWHGLPEAVGEGLGGRTPRMGKHFIRHEILHCKDQSQAKKS